MKFAIYNQLGQILRTVECPENLLQYQIVTNEYAIEIDNHVSWDTHYIVNNQVCALPIKPNVLSKFDYLNKVWIDDSEQAIIQIIQNRLNLLQKSDWTQLPNSPLTAEKQQAWATYRQALRDIPTQTGYPFNVVWPIPPTTN